MFDFHFSLYWLVFSALSAIFAGLLGASRQSSDDRDYYGGRDSPERVQKAGLASKLPFSLPAMIVAFGFGIIVQYFDFYMMLPNLTGPFGGFFIPLLLAWVPGLFIALVASGMSRRAILGGLASGVVLFGWPIVLYFCYNVGASNAANFAHLPNITIASDSEQMPPTDPNHLVMVTPDMAALDASTALTNDPKDPNLSTQFQVGNLTLQSINGHRYYAAPLEPVNSGDAFWTPLFGGRSDSPGYILVDAENVQATAQIRLGFHISLFDDGAFAMNVTRYLYQDGFTNGDLDDPTFEVDDNYQPHWTVAYVQPAFGNFSGSKVSKLIVVDVAQHDPIVHAYDPADPQVAWVDRVVSKDLVLEYATDWGAYHTDYAQASFSNWLSVAWGFHKTDVTEPSDGQYSATLTYTNGQQNGWVIPMTSANSSDSSVLDVLVFDTKENKGIDYPGLHGFNHADSAAETMFDASQNRINKYTVDSMELYSIYGHPTWVAIYTNVQANGATFGAIGFMSANNQNVSDVAYANNLQDALSQYSEILANGSDGSGVTQTSQTVSFKGTIWRIAFAGDDQWLFQLFGDKHYFTVAPKNYAGAPLLRDNDHVEGTYLDTDQLDVSVSKLMLLDPGENGTPPTVSNTK